MNGLLPLSLIADEYGTLSVIQAATGENILQVLGERDQMEARARYIADTMNRTRTFNAYGGLNDHAKGQWQQPVEK